MSWLDMLDRDVAKGDYVVYYSNIYQVVDLVGQADHCRARIILIDKSKTTRSTIKYCRDMCIIPKEDILVWRLKKDY